MKVKKRISKKAPVREMALGGALSGGFGGAKSGASALSFLGPWGTVAGGVLGGAMGLFSGNKEEDAQMAAFENSQKEAKQQKKDQFDISNRARIAGADVKGVESYNFYADGGLIGGDYEVEGDEVVQGDDVILGREDKLASDVTKAVGPTHAEGGVQGTGGERVYSDRIPVSDFIRELIEKDGGGKVKGKTFAEVAEEIGKKKGKFEKKLDSNFEPSRATATKMLSKLDTSLDTLFNFQQLENENSTGEVKKYPFGGSLPYNEENPLLKIPTMSSKANLETFTPKSAIWNPSTMAPVPVAATESAPVDPASRIGVAPSKYVGPTEGGAGVSGTVGGDTRDVFGKAQDSAQDNLGQFANLANYLGNKSDIAKMRTDVQRTLVSAPIYNYRDRSDNPTREVNRSVRAGINSLESSSRTVNAANVGNLIARGMDATNQIASNEAERRDRYENDYNSRALGIEAANADTINQANDARRDLFNKKYSFAPQQNRTAFTKGIIDNETTKRNQKNDANKMMLSYLSNNEDGALDRQAGKLGFDSNEFMRRLSYGRSLTR